MGGEALLTQALDQLQLAVEHVIKSVDEGGADGYDNAEFVTAMQAFEQIRNRLSVVDHRLIADGMVRELPDRLTQRSMAQVLVSALRLSPGEAARRIRAAEKLGEQTSMLGEPLGARWPALAASQRAGLVSPEQVAIIERALGPLERRGFDPAAVTAGERLLTEHAATFGPKDLKIVADRLANAIDPDGTRPDDQLNTDRRFLHLRPTGNGAWTGEFRLTGPLGSKLHALLDPLAKPRITTTMTEDGRWVEEPDARTHGQRMHDALEDICDRLLRADNTIPDSAGTPATVIITIDLADLLAKTGYGISSDGTLVRTDTVLTMADQAELYFAALNAHGVPLHLGRSRRIASRGQSIALTARDGGCSFPGCGIGPAWCERHHIVAWIDGGLTDLDNLTLLCRYHHGRFAQRGWQCRISTAGLPEWIPPKYLDRQQRPLINNRIRGTSALRELQLRAHV
jgi:hypothetical protein